MKKEDGRKRDLLKSLLHLIEDNERQQGKRLGIYHSRGLNKSGAV